jgi:1-acyl-sn-glycerol-3-phosphate acyltransferase
MPKASHPIVRTYRTLRIVVHILYGLSVSGLILSWLNEDQRQLMIQRWSKKLLSILNIKLSSQGNTPQQKLKNAMFVSNHISWLDIYALNSVHPVRFIAKSEVARWPVFGWLARKSNTLFIDRTKKKDAQRVSIEASKSLKNGDCLCYFPEGTTSQGNILLPFKSSLMQAAIDANAEIRPFTIFYPKPDGSANIAMAFAGETTFIASIWQIIASRESQVTLHFLPSLQSQGYERRVLTEHVKTKIAFQLNFND